MVSLGPENSSQLASSASEGTVAAPVYAVLLVKKQRACVNSALFRSSIVGRKPKAVGTDAVEGKASFSYREEVR
jgi:hypothetical protein